MDVTPYPDAVRVVLSNDGFVHVGGTEQHLLTLGTHLQRLGHEATVFANRLGPFADHVRDGGIAVVDDVAALDDDVDLLFSQDAVVAHQLADRFPQVPHVFRCCSDVFDFELPPQLPDVVDLVVVLSERYERLVRATGLDVGIVRLRIPVDLDVFSPHVPIRPAPRKAALLGNYPDRHDIVRRAWGDRLELVEVGGPNARFDPAAALADVDIVIAKTRAVVDAMAAGRAVYLYDCMGGDGWVTPQTYPLMEADNFAGQATDVVVDEERLRRDLDGYDASMGTINRDLALQHHGARDHTVAFLEAVADLAPRPRPASMLRELSRLTDLQWSWERLGRENRAWAMELRLQLREAEDRLADLERSVVDAESQATSDREAAAAAEERARSVSDELEAMRRSRAWRLASQWGAARRRLRRREP